MKMKLKVLVLREILFLLYILVIVVVLHYLHQERNLSSLRPQPMAQAQQDPSTDIRGEIHEGSRNARRSPLKMHHQRPRVEIQIDSNDDDDEVDSVPMTLPPARPLERELPLQSLHSLSSWRAHLQHYCRLMGRQRSALDKLQHLIVDDRYKVIYCPVAKVASTNWKRVFLVLGGHVTTRDPRAIPAPQVHALASSRLRFLGQLSPAQARYKLQHYFKFMVSRDPFERLLSAYRNKVGNPRNGVYQKSYARMIARRYRSKPRDQANDVTNVTFAEFLQYVSDPTLPDHSDPHWARETDVCHPCTVYYHFIGHADTLEQDASYVLRKIRAPKGLRFPSFPTSKRSSRAHLRDFYSQVPSAYKDQVYRRYYADFVLFNHSVPHGVQTDTRDLA